MNKTKKIIVGLILFLSVLSLDKLCAKDDPKKNVETEEESLFANEPLLFPLFEKLYDLETQKENKVNIVHIGDSHIQADFFTNTIREGLQRKFGNGGFGFTFPYSLVKTNGPRFIKYRSNTTWRSQSNVAPFSEASIGLSGIALYTPLQDFVLQLTAEDGYEFNTIKVIYPTIEPQFKLSVTASPLEVSVSSGGNSSGGFNYHTVKSGESLSVISKKYGVTVAQIKSANGLKSNLIRTKQRLRIPAKGRTSTPKTLKSNIKIDSTDCVNMISNSYYSSYTSDTLLKRITFVPDTKLDTYNLNGLVVENNHSGIIYHSIGVNGARMVDYAKYPLFFEQLSILNPDLIVLSFGTNESFAKMSDSEYVNQLNDFVASIQEKNGDATILVMTPPPSMFRRTRVNTYVSDYSTALMGINHLPVWDLYSRMGGASGIRVKGQYARKMDRRKVHYTVDGYQSQGELFIDDFISAYNNFKENHKTN